MQIKVEQGLSSLRNPLGPFKIKTNFKDSFKKKVQVGLWTMKENAKCVSFLIVHQSDILGKEIKQLWSLFMKMAAFIGSRNARQCMSWYRKLLKKFSSVPQIIKSLLTVPDIVALVDEQSKEMSQLFVKKVHPKVQFPRENRKSNASGITSDCYADENSKAKKGLKQSNEELLSSKYFTKNRVECLSDCNFFFTMWISKLSQLSSDRPPFG